MANEPGWYADPWQPGRRRWWDGAQWTDHTADASPPPVQPWEQQWHPVTAWQPVDPIALARQEITAEREIARWARVGFIAGAVAAVISNIILAATIGDTVDRLRGAFDGRTTNTSFSGFGFGSPLGLVSLAATIVAMIWSFRAMHVARNLRYPHTYSVGWSVAGWIVPILSFWFPYVTVRDLLPAGHPMRRTVGQWWAFHLVGTFGGLAVFGVAFASTSVAVALLLPVTLCAVLAANLAVRLVDAILDDHTRAVARVTGVG